MDFLELALYDNSMGVVWAVVTRLHSSGNAFAQQTLTVGHAGLCEFRGAASRGGLRIGRQIQLFEDAAVAGQARMPYKFNDELVDAVWDKGTASIYAIEGTALLRICGDTVSLVTDDPCASGDDAYHLRCITSDGGGTLFVVDSNGTVSKVQLPAAWMTAGCGTAPAAPASRAAASEGVTTATDAVVAKVLEQTAADITYATYDAGSDDAASSRHSGLGASLVYASETAIYRLPLVSSSPSGGPLLLAGREGEASARDGRGAAAGFGRIRGLALASDGCLYVADSPGGTTSVRKVTRDGTVTTVTGGLDVSATNLAILPNSYLTVCGEGKVLVLDLGLPPPRDALPPRPPPGPPRRTLPADLGALLDRQPDGSADLEVIVGDRAFPVHRALLAARCDYFRQRLGGGFADGGAARIDLPDADPEAFALALRYLYTGAVDIPAASAQAVAELADRLLLPELCLDAQARVLAEVAPESVVGAMLWAESRGAGFAQLLADLMDWYLQHSGEVRRQAPASLMRLAESPALMVTLLNELDERGEKKRRIF